jgi:hypothetical protein
LARSEPPPYAVLALQIQRDHDLPAETVNLERHNRLAELLFPSQLRDLLQAVAHELQATSSGDD